MCNRGQVPNVALRQPSSAARLSSRTSHGCRRRPSNLTRRTYPGAVVADYTYDPLDRLASVASGGQTTSYAYDVASNLAQTTLPAGNGYVETRSYDRAGRLTDVESKKGASTLSKFALALDAVGNPTQVVRTGSLAQTQTYTYDASDRILSVCFQTGTCPGASDPFIRWTYDKVGNRLSEARPGTSTVNYTYDARDRLLSAGSTSYTYDQNGNELSAGSRSFTYDLANRLKTTTSGSTTTTYLYDGDGGRLQASTGTQASKKTNYLWDVAAGLPQVALERDGNNSLLRRYTYGAKRISMTAGSSTSYYIYDGLGSTANLTSSSGATQWTWSYEPYGSIRTETKANGSQPDNFMKFTGEYLDPTGLYHLRARQYDPASGRFISPDPAPQRTEDPTSCAYAYVASRPTTAVDPTGMTLRPSSKGPRSVRTVQASAAWAATLDEIPIGFCHYYSVPTPQGGFGTIFSTFTVKRRGANQNAVQVLKGNIVYGYNVRWALRDLFHANAGVPSVLRAFGFDGTKQREKTLFYYNNADKLDRTNPVLYSLHGNFVALPWTLVRFKGTFRLDPPVPIPDPNGNTALVNRLNANVECWAT